MFELEERVMLGNGTQGDSGQIGAHGDVVAELLDRIVEGARVDDTDGGNGGNGAGNNGGDGGGKGGGDGGDPYDAPVSIKMLLATAKQIAEFVTLMSNANLNATEKATDMAIDAIGNRHDGVLSVVQPSSPSRSGQGSRTRLIRWTQERTPPPPAHEAPPPLSTGRSGPPRRSSRRTGSRAHFWRCGSSTKALRARQAPSL
jgi:hypothetical protein